MKMRLFWSALAIGFVAVNVYAFLASGFPALWVFFTTLEPWGILTVTDLLLALTIGIFLMWKDATTKGVHPLPYAVLTLATGSLGLLVYLVRYWGAPRHLATNQR